MKLFIYYLLLATLIPICFSDEAVKMGVVTFAANEKLVEQQVAEKIIRKIYSKMNVNLTLLALPPLRGRAKNLQGRIDGEIARIYKYGVNNPSLIRVDPPYYYFTSTAFCLDPEKINITKKSDLKNYKIVATRGVTHSEEVAKLNPGSLIISDGLQMYDLLLQGAVDVAIDAGINGRKIIKMKRYSAIKDCGTLAKYDLYNFLNVHSVKYKAPLSAMITKLKESGELDRMIVEAEEEFIAK